MRAEDAKNLSDADLRKWIRNDEALYNEGCEFARQKDPASDEALGTLLDEHIDDFIETKRDEIIERIESRLRSGR